MSTFLRQNQQEKSSADAIEQYFNDRERFKFEMEAQLQSHVMKHATQTRRKDADFIASKVDERQTVGLQDLSMRNDIANMEGSAAGYAQQEANDEDFDKEAYYKLKQDLAEKKAAKERLLSQGLPQFKAYLRF